MPGLRRTRMPWRRKATPARTIGNHQVRGSNRLPQLWLGECRHRHLGIEGDQLPAAIAVQFHRGGEHIEANVDRHPEHLLAVTGLGLRTWAEPLTRENLIDDDQPDNADQCWPGTGATGTPRRPGGPCVPGQAAPITGLMPASTANTVHGNYGDAWVRDNVTPFRPSGVWRWPGGVKGNGLRVYALEQSVLALMRGLMRSMMAQAAKVERFKASQELLDALHAKYDTATGQPVVADNAWGHLQLDATSLFVLQLAQLTRSGLVVVANAAQAAFLQNLIYYLCRAYRVADYGIWERGDKGNNGAPERNASSIGLKAALEASAAWIPWAPWRWPPHPLGAARCGAAPQASLGGSAAAGIGQQGGR